MTGDNKPVPGSSLDRAALERVLARAAQLHAQDSTDPGTSLSDEQIVELGKEVGLTPQAIRQAIAEERGRVPEPETSGAAGSLFGPSSVSATRVVRGNTGALLAALDSAMRNELPFDVSRRFPTRMQWTPKRGFFDVMRSQFVRGAEGADAKLAEEVAATAIALDDDRVQVRLDGFLANTRKTAVRRTLIVAAFSALMAAGAGVAGVSLAVAIPIFAVGSLFGYAHGRSTYRSAVRKVSIALEQLLDRLEFGPARKRDNIVDRLLR